MINSKNIDNYKRIIKENIGTKINLTLKKGRKYITLNECIIKNAYNAIFVVEICGDSMIRCKAISISYADLLTGSARVVLLSNSKGA